MKSIRIMAAALLMAASFTVVAQDKAKSESKAATKSTATEGQLKQHQCNSKCTAAAHNYVHGEKGHTCTAECKKSATKKA